VFQVFLFHQILFPLGMKKNPHFLNVLFSFYNFFLHDDGALLIFYLDYLNVLKDILGYLSSNNFKIHKK
jgi:hypothetical protein